MGKDTIAARLLCQQHQKMQWILGADEPANPAGTQRVGNLAAAADDPATMSALDGTRNSTAYAEAQRKIADAKAKSLQARLDGEEASPSEVWEMDGKPGELGLPHRGVSIEWDWMNIAGVKHFKMALPDPPAPGSDEEPTPYKWQVDPELSEVRRLYEYRHAGAVELGAPGGSGASENAAEQAYLLPGEEQMHTADLIVFCVKGGAYLDVRHHLKPKAWSRVCLLPGDMVQIPEGLLYRFVPAILGGEFANPAAAPKAPAARRADAAAAAAAELAGTMIVVMTKQTPTVAQCKAPLTPAAVSAYEKRHKEPHPSILRYQFLFVRPKPSVCS